MEGTQGSNVPQQKREKHTKEPLQNGASKKVKKPVGIDLPSTTLTAFEVREADQELRRSPRERDWMEVLAEKYAYRCLPLVVANQIGWEVLNPRKFTAVWNGGIRSTDVQITFDDGGEPSSYVACHFSNGILTFQMDYIFRTPEGHNLWVRGPANRPKTAISALEGIVETDWAPYSFTMNWRFTVPNVPVTFEKGEPICLLVPYPRHYIEAFDPELRHLTEDQKLCKDHSEWCKSRKQFLKDLKDPESGLSGKSWQKNYFQGKDWEGNKVSDHQTKLGSKEFVDKRKHKPCADQPKQVVDAAGPYAGMNKQELLESIQRMVNASVRQAVAELAVAFRREMRADEESKYTASDHHHYDEDEE